VVAAAGATVTLTVSDGVHSVVVLAVIGGCTAAEISRRESIPLGTAKSRIRIGLEKLRQIWEEDRHE